MTRAITIEDVERALRAPLPGMAAQGRMATRPRTRREDFAHTTPPREGAVLILLYPREGRLYFPLTQRTAHLAQHSGQISLPGGAHEPEDESLWATALREAAEEIGLEAPVRYLAALSPFYIAPSNFDLHPFVGHVLAPPLFKPDPNEVAELIEMSLDALLDPAIKAEETRLWRGRMMQMPYYAYQGRVIWGATAMVLSELEALLAAVMSGGPS